MQHGLLEFHRYTDKWNILKVYTNVVRGMDPRPNTMINEKSLKRTKLNERKHK